MNNKYEGHTPGPWVVKKCCDSPSCYLYHISNGVFERATGFDITDAYLIADAPLLAEKVGELEGIINTQRGTIENYYETTKKLAEQNEKMLTFIKRDCADCKTSGEPLPNQCERCENGKLIAEIERSK